MTLPLTATGQPRDTDGKFGEKNGSAPEVELGSGRVLVTLDEAKAIAHEVMDEHGLRQDGWRFEWDRATSRFGQCRYNHRAISMSAVMTVHRTADEVRQTMIHEAAHALTKGENHNRVWLAKARSMGYTGARTRELPEGYERPDRSNGAQTAAYGSTTIHLGDKLEYQGRGYTVKTINRSRAVCTRDDGTEIHVPFSIITKYRTGGNSQPAAPRAADTVQSINVSTARSTPRRPEPGETMRYNGTDYTLLRVNRTRAVCKRDYDGREYTVPLAMFAKHRTS